MRSAGAKPGPSLQPSGGTQAVADAYVVLGLCSPDGLLGGEDEARFRRRPRRLSRASARDCERECSRKPRERRSAGGYRRGTSAAGSSCQRLARRGVDAAQYSLLRGCLAPPAQPRVCQRLHRGGAMLSPARSCVRQTPGLLCALGCLVVGSACRFRSSQSIGKTAETITRTMRYVRFVREANRQTHEERARGNSRPAPDCRRRLLSSGFCARPLPTAANRSKSMLLYSAGGDSRGSALERWFHERYGLVYGYADRAAPVAPAGSPRPRNALTGRSTERSQKFERASDRSPQQPTEPCTTVAFTSAARAMRRARSRAGARA